MTHPTDRLADLVDGTLTGPDRDEVLAHVRACARCEAEVRAAGEARAALHALAAPATPPEIGDRAVAEARRAAAGGGARNPWARALPALGVAAAIVLAVALFLPRIGDEVESPVTAAGDAASAPAASATAVEVIDHDFDLADVAALAADAATAAGGSDAEGANQPFGDANTVTTRAVAPAIECITEAFRELPGTPVRLLQARFEHQAAYFAVVEAGPGGGQAADRRYVLVAAQDDCRQLQQTRVLIP
jgi:putative zinc finger protein